MLAGAAILVNYGSEVGDDRKCKVVLVKVGPPQVGSVGGVLSKQNLGNLETITEYSFHMNKTKECWVRV